MVVGLPVGVVCLRLLDPVYVELLVWLVLLHRYNFLKAQAFGLIHRA